jgi:hypothetical protein
MINAPAALAGPAAGAGLAVMAAGWRRPPPDLRAVLARLDGAEPRQRARRPVLADHDSDLANAADGPLTRYATRWADRLAEHLARAGEDLRQSPLARAARLDRLSADLDLLGETVELLVVRKLGYLLLGLAFPPILATVLALIGSSLPWGLPMMAALALGGVLFMMPDVDVHGRARAARAELRAAVCAYLEMVALERAADAGAIEAVERAATIGDTPAFERIRAALTKAQLDGVPPWRGLSDLAASTGVAELGDVADIMASSGRDGAAVYGSLRARAASLRSAITAERAAAANAASERVVIPVAALGLVFMALVAYPAFVRLVLGP